MAWPKSKDRTRIYDTNSALQRAQDSQANVFQQAANAADMFAGGATTRKATEVISRDFNRNKDLRKMYSQPVRSVAMPTEQGPIPFSGNNRPMPAYNEAPVISQNTQGLQQDPIHLQANQSKIKNSPGQRGTLADTFWDASTGTAGTREEQKRQFNARQAGVGTGRTFGTPRRGPQQTMSNRDQVPNFSELAKGFKGSAKQARIASLKNQYAKERRGTADAMSMANLNNASLENRSSMVQDAAKYKTYADAKSSGLNRLSNAKSDKNKARVQQALQSQSIFANSQNQLNTQAFNLQRDANTRDAATARQNQAFANDLYLAGGEGSAKLANQAAQGELNYDGLQDRSIPQKPSYKWYKGEQNIGVGGVPVSTPGRVFNENTGEVQLDFAGMSDAQIQALIDNENKRR